MMTYQPALLPTFDGIHTRVLAARERPYPTEAAAFPLVLEAGDRRDVEGLKRALGRHSNEITRTIHDFGAILLRGFEIRSDDDFAAVITSIDGLRPMAGYFMAEPGRSLVDGTSHVFHTNTLGKTGGGFSRLGEGFHSENYYSVDTPAFQTFWCKQRPWLGGETALVHSARAYGEWSPGTRARLEAQSVCHPAVWPISLVARVYGRSEAQIEAFFHELGLDIVTVEQERYLILQKPSVYRHPHTRQATLSANLSAELPELGPALRARLLPHYAGWKWVLHRLAWSHPRLLRLFAATDNLPTLLRYHPRYLWMRTVGAARIKADRQRHKARRAPEDVPGTVTLGQIVTPSEVESLASALWKHCSVFSWKRGDVLIWDNLQVLHAGMPGLGPRELRVMLCNPVSLTYPLRGAPAEPVLDGEQPTVDARLRSQQGDG